MTDTSEVRRKILSKILSSPLTLLPFVVGTTIMVALWAAGTHQDIGVLAGLAGVLGSAGVFVNRLLFRGERLAEEAVTELMDESDAERERMLDDLDARLSADDDPRTEAALRDLRLLQKTFEELLASGTLDLNTVSATDIVSGIQQLFDQCVASLEQTLRLAKTIRGLRTSAARAPIIQQRKEILADVESSIRQFGEVLAAVHKFGEQDKGATELARVGKELDQRLAVAKQVESRIKAFERQLISGDHE